RGSDGGRVGAAGRQREETGFSGREPAGGRWGFDGLRSRVRALGLSNGGGGSTGSARGVWAATGQASVPVRAGQAARAPSMILSRSCASAPSRARTESPYGTVV